MRIDTKEIPGLRDLTLDTADSVRFDSALPSAEVIRLAWGNPDLADIVSDEAIGQAMTTNAARANRWVQGISAVNLGVPSGILPAFEKAVWKWGPSSWAEYGRGQLTSAMDLGLDAMGCVPVIGVAAKFAVALVQRLVSMSAKKKPLPQSMRYEKLADVKKANSALQAFYGKDARSIFLPPALNVRAWRVAPATPGFAVKYEGEPGGFGVVPGTNIVAGALDSDVHWTAENYLACNSSGRVCSDPKGELNSSQRASVRRDWDRVFEGTIASNGEHLPSLRRLGTALWPAVTSTRTAAAFELDTRGIAKAWEDWTDAAYSLAADAMNGGVKMYLDRYVGFQALQRSTRLPCYGVEGDISLGTQARRRMREVRRVQEELLDTLVVAYCSQKQPAFRDETLAQKLQERRDQLLTHPARWKVSRADVVDETFRGRLEAATPDSGRPLAAPVGSDFEHEPVRVSPVSAPSDTGGSAGGLLLLAAGAAVASSVL